jgi:hypothetical protein
VAAADAEMMKISSQADAELSAFRKDQHQRALEWCERFQPIWLVRLKGWFGPSTSCLRCHGDCLSGLRGAQATRDFFLLALFLQTS